MNAQPALVRPRFASDYDPLVALWIARLTTGFPAAVSILNDGLNSEDLRQILGLSPLDGTFRMSALKPHMKIRAEELEQQRPRRKTILARNSRDVLHIHGSLHTPRCFACNRPYDFPAGIPR